jgi:hypothetical protein
MREWIKKNWIIIGAAAVLLAALTVGLVEYKNGNQNKKKTVKQIPIILPTGIVEPTPTLAADNLTAPPAAIYGRGPNSNPKEQAQQEAELLQNQRDYPLVDVLPYKGSDFTVDHYREPKTLVVIVTNTSNKTTVETEVNEWLVRNGQLNGSHKIIWELGKL